MSETKTVTNDWAEFRKRVGDAGAKSVRVYVWGEVRAKQAASAWTAVPVTVYECHVVPPPQGDDPFGTPAGRETIQPYRTEREPRNAREDRQDLENLVASLESLGVAVRVIDGPPPD
jgi:hypothetical protein